MPPYRRRRRGWSSRPRAPIASWRSIRRRGVSPAKLGSASARSCVCSCRRAGFRRSPPAPSSSRSEAAWRATSTARTIIATDPSAGSWSSSGCAPPTAPWSAAVRTHERELFLATVGGMGLTGLIVEVTFRLRRVESPWIVLESRPVSGLDEMLDGLRESAADWTYTVGWIDCLARGGALGRGVLLRGRHALRDEGGPRAPRSGRMLRVPLRRAGMAPESRVHAPLQPPLSRAAGLPARAAPGLLRSVLLPARCDPRVEPPLWRSRIPSVPVRDSARSGRHARCAPSSRSSPTRGPRRSSPSSRISGPAPSRICPFPIEGTTLSLDLPYRGQRTEDLVHELNAVVIRAGGRIYLAKDAVTRAEDFALMTPRLDEWKAARDRWDPERRFRSAQSVRLFGDPA